MSGATTDDYVSVSELEHLLFVYTDGCCIGNSTKTTCPSGWGVTISKPRPVPSRASNERVSIQSLESDASKCELIDELYGPVVLDTNSQFFMGATVGSNNTAELTAIGEGLLWILSYIRKILSLNSRTKQRVIIRYDSEYAANSVLGIFNGKKNVELIQKIRTIYHQVKSLVSSIQFLHVKCHSGHPYNDRADRLANQGAAMPGGTGGRYSTTVVSTVPNVAESQAASRASPISDSTGTDDSLQASDLPLILFMYTDGCCIGNSTHHACPAGWGVTITRPIAAVAMGNSQRIDVKALEVDTSKCEKVDELYGPVVLDASSPFYLGATVGSNNTAELSAIGEALLWVLGYVRTSNLQGSNSNQSIKRLRIFIRYDSEYAAKSVQGIFNGKKNVELIEKIRVILRKVKNVVGSVTFLHVKGHSGHLYNDRADQLANLGAALAMGTGGRYSEGDAYNIDISGLEKDTSNAASQSENISQAFDTKEAQGRVSHRSGTGVELSAGSHDYLAERTRIPVKPVLSLFKSSAAAASTIAHATAAMNGSNNAGTVVKTPNSGMRIETQSCTSSTKRTLETPVEATPSKRLTTVAATTPLVSSGNSRSAVIDLTDPVPTGCGARKAVIVDSDSEVEEVVFLSEDES